MATLKNVGPDPATQYDVVHRKYLNQLVAQNLSQAEVDALVTSGLSSYATKAYVDSRDALNATPAYVDTADATRIPLTAIDVAGGPVSLDAQGKVDPDVIDIPNTQRWPEPPVEPSSYMGAPVTVSGMTEATVHTVTVADPGHPYKLLASGQLDVGTSADGALPVVLLRAGSATTGPLIGRGYGVAEAYGSPPPFDTVGPGFTGQTQNPSCVHAATAGAYVIVDISVYGNFTVSSVTHDGVAMTLLSSQTMNNSATNGILARYGRANVASGTKTIAVQLSGVTHVTISSVSYTGVASVGATTKVYGAGAPLSQTITGALPSTQRAVQSFACRQAGTTLTVDGAASRYSNARLLSGTYYAALAASDTGLPTVITATADTPGPWAALATALNSVVTNNHSQATITPLYGATAASAPVFEIAGPGVVTSTAKDINYSFTHTPSAGALVVVDVVVLGSPTINTCTYAGTAMLLLGSVGLNNDTETGRLYRYAIIDSTGGTKTIALTFSTYAAIVGSSVSYRNVAQVSTSVTSYSSGGSSTSHTVSAYPYGGQLVLQTFAVDQVNPTNWTTNQTRRYHRVLSGSAAGVPIDGAITVSEASGPATFTATATSIGNTASLATVLVGPTLGSPAQSPRTGDTTVYVNLAASGSASATATGFHAGLSVVPIPS